MSGCHFCTKAKNLLKSAIESGEVELIPASEAPTDVRGFPHFTFKDQSHSGLPKLERRVIRETRI